MYFQNSTPVIFRSSQSLLFSVFEFRTVLFRWRGSIQTHTLTRRSSVFDPSMAETATTSTEDRSKDGASSRRTWHKHSTCLDGRSTRCCSARSSRTRRFLPTDASSLSSATCPFLTSERASSSRTPFLGLALTRDGTGLVIAQRRRRSI